MNTHFKLLLLAAGLYAGHNLLNLILYGFNPILLITLVPYVLVAVFWGKMHGIFKAIVLALLAAVEIPQVPVNFHGLQFATLSGVLLLSAMAVMVCIALSIGVRLARGKQNTLQVSKGEHVQ